MATDERSSIVDWLRHGVGDDAARLLADAIECGEHVGWSDRQESEAHAQWLEATRELRASRHERADWDGGP